MYLKLAGDRRKTHPDHFLAVNLDQDISNVNMIQMGRTTDRHRFNNVLSGQNVPMGQRSKLDTHARLYQLRCNTGFIRRALRLRFRLRSEGFDLFLS